MRGCNSSILPTTLLIYCSAIYPQGMTFKYDLGGRLAVAQRTGTSLMSRSVSTGHSPRYSNGCDIYKKTLVRKEFAQDNYRKHP